VRTADDGGPAYDGPVTSLPLLAHAGGWDELLIAAGAVFLVVLLRLRTERRRRDQEEGDGREERDAVEADAD
jgi:hypothetical protein